MTLAIIALAPVALVAILAIAALVFAIASSGGRASGNRMLAPSNGFEVWVQPEDNAVRWTVWSGGIQLATSTAANETDAFAEAKEWIETITATQPVVTSAAQKPKGTETPESETPPASIAEGGVPPVPGWMTYAWYSYRGQWIRIDIGPRPANDPQLRVASSLPEGSPAMHYAKFYRPWRWSVIAGQATPLGTALVSGPFEVGSFGSYPDEEAALDEISDLVARLGADWVDTTFGVGAALAKWGGA